MKINIHMRRFVLLLAVALFAPVTARSEVTGGGWIRGVNGGKATFSVDLADDGTGTFTYKDSNFRNSDFPKGINLEGIIESSGLVYFDTVEASGSYTAKRGGTSGYFVAFFTDTGESGPQKGDELVIDLYSDPDHLNLLYENSRVLGNGTSGGGNITVTIAGASTGALAVFGTFVLAWASWRRWGTIFGDRH